MHTVCFDVFWLGLVMAIYQYRDYGDATWAPSCAKSPTNSLSFHPFVQVYIEGNNTAVCYWIFGSRINVRVVGSPHKGSVYRKMSPCHNVIIDLTLRQFMWLPMLVKQPWKIWEIYFRESTWNLYIPHNHENGNRFKTTLSNFRSSSRYNLSKWIRAPFQYEMPPYQYRDFRVKYKTVSRQSSYF